MDSKRIFDVKGIIKPLKVILSVIFCGLFFTNATAQTTIQVNSTQNNVPIKEVVLVVDRNGPNEQRITQTTQGLANPLPIDVRVEVESILLENGEKILATSRFPKVLSANPLLGSNQDESGIRVVKFDHENTNQHITHANNLPEFLTAMADVVSIPDLRSYWDINPNGILNEDNDFVDVIYRSQIPQSGYILVTERNGNSKFDLVALDENGFVIENANRISFIAQFDWNSGVNHQINQPTQSQWLTIFNPELFDTDVPIFGFRITDRLESDGKIVFFARDLSATPDNLCPVFSSVGSENAGNIFENDELDGRALNPVDINLTVFDEDNVLTGGSISLNQDPNSPEFGNIAVLPNATPGTYNFEYEIEDKLDGRTDRTVVTVRVIEFLDLKNEVYCVGDQAQALFISEKLTSGLTYQWYSNQSNSNVGGQPIEGETSAQFTPVTEMEGVSYYYVEVTNECGESLTSSVAKIITNFTDLPVSTGNITECALETIQTLNANDAIATEDNIEILWYTTPDGDSRITAPIWNQIGTVTYYAEAVNKITGCASATRTPVVLTLHDCQITITKTVDLTEIDSPTTLNFTIEVTNTGTLDATNVSVTDPLTNGSDPLQLISGDNNNDNILNLNETWIYETSFQVTQELIDLGQDIVNIAFVTSIVTNEESSSTTTIINQNSTISLNKSADKAIVSQAGEEVVYTLTVTNTGNTTLTGVVIEDAMLGVTETVGTLAPGATASFNYTYTVTQADIDNGSIVNVASTTGEDPNGDTTEGDATLTIDVDQNSAIELAKSADKSVVTEAGEEVVYTLTVTNTGNTTLTDVVIEDAMLNVSENVGTLLPGQSASRDYTYTVTQSDIDNGSIVNVASTTGEDPNGDTPGDDDEVTVDVACIDSTLVSGVIFNEQTGEPLAGVPVTLIPQGTTSGETLILVTGEDGRYAFRDMSAGSYLVQVQDANLNAVRNLYPVTSSLFFTEINLCEPVSNDFGYEIYEGIVIGDFVWYDLNGDGIQNEWYDANNDGIVTQNEIGSGAIALGEWEWFDLNGDGRYDGPENEGELNKAGFGNAQSANITVTGPNGFTNDVIIGVLGNYRTRPDVVQFGFGEYTSTLTIDDFLDAEAQRLANTGLVKVLPNLGSRMNGINEEDGGARMEVQCGLTTGAEQSRNYTSSERIFLDMDFGIRCKEAEIRIIANDDEYGEFNTSFEGSIGNILDNDLLDGQPVTMDNVDFVFTELDGIVGLLINPNGELSLIPGVNEPRDYTLRYVLSETGFPSNNDDAFVTFRILNDEVDMSVTKTSFDIEVFEGDEFEYEIVVRNNSENDAADVEIVDDLPNGLSYISSTITSSDPAIQAATVTVGNRITWTVSVFPAGAIMTIRVLVKAEALSSESALSVTNIVTVNSGGVEINPTDNTDSDLNTVNPFFIPNVITPNGDNRNDTFEIKGLGKFPGNELVIINRYGDHVFERTNYQNDWAAEGLPAGTYYFVLVATDSQGRSHDFKGWVQVIK